MPSEVADRVEIQVFPYPDSQREHYAVNVVVDQKHCIPAVCGVSKAQAQRVAKRIQLLLYELDGSEQEIKGGMRQWKKSAC